MAACDESPGGDAGVRAGRREREKERVCLAEAHRWVTREGVYLWVSSGDLRWCARGVLAQPRIWTHLKTGCMASRMLVWTDIEVVVAVAGIVGRT